MFVDDRRTHTDHVGVHLGSRAYVRAVSSKCKCKCKCKFIAPTGDRPPYGGTQTGIWNGEATKDKLAHLRKLARPLHKPRTASKHTTQDATPEPPLLHTKRANKHMRYAAVICFPRVIQYEIHTAAHAGETLNSGSPLRHASTSQSQQRSVRWWRNRAMCRLYANNRIKKAGGVGAAGWGARKVGGVCLPHSKVSLRPAMGGSVASY